MRSLCATAALCATLLVATSASAQSVIAGTPLRPEVRPATARVLAESGAALLGGVVVPAVIYFGATQAHSFEGFFGGFGGSVLAAPVLGVASVYRIPRQPENVNGAK
ncbi:MAG: hypothetical protein WCJ30_19320 [Deltaproteobacteria bacterium]